MARRKNFIEMQVPKPTMKGGRVQDSLPIVTVKAPTLGVGVETIPDTGKNKQEISLKSATGPTLQLDMPSNKPIPLGVVTLDGVRETSATAFSASCPDSTVVGDLVHIVAENSVEKVDVTISNTTKVPMVGVVIAKTSGATCLVKWTGVVEGVYVGLTPGKVYFVGTDSRPTVVPVTPPVGGFIWLQKIGLAMGPKDLLLIPDFNMVKLVG